MIRWRAKLRSLLATEDEGGFSELPQNALAISKRLHAVDCLFNGDLRRTDEIQHYCSATCCPGGKEETLRKFMGEHGVLALLSPLPSVFPRKQWQGQATVVSHINLLEGVHGMLSAIISKGGKETTGRRFSLRGNTESTAATVSVPEECLGRPLMGARVPMAEPRHCGLP